MTTNCPALTQAHAQRSTLCSLTPTPKPGPPEACFPWGQASTSDSALLHPWCPGNNKKDDDDKNNNSKLFYRPYLPSATVLSTLPVPTPLIFTTTLESRYLDYSLLWVGNRHSESLSNVPKVTQLGRVGAKVQRQVCGFEASLGHFLAHPCFSLSLFIL